MVLKTSFQPIKSEDQCCVPVIPATWGSTNRRIMVQTGLSIKQDCISKITKTKRLRAWLKCRAPSEQAHENPSSNTSTRIK
jgi:hypothetical protein